MQRHLGGKNLANEFSEDKTLEVSNADSLPQQGQTGSNSNSLTQHGALGSQIKTFSQLT